MQVVSAPRRAGQRRALVSGVVTHGLFVPPSLQANNWAAYDDWRRARDQWDYFYSRNR